MKILPAIVVALSLTVGVVAPAQAVQETPPEDFTENVENVLEQEGLTAEVAAEPGQVIEDTAEALSEEDADGSPSEAVPFAPGNTSAFSAQSTVGKNSFVLPMKPGYRVTSYFGNRCPPVVGGGLYHGAIDLAAADGQPLYAMRDGVVASYVPGSPTSTGTLRIDHGVVDGKRLLSSYGHMWEPLKYVKVGQKVKKGQRIGDVGASGYANGPHLHLAMQHGNAWIDPLTFLESRGLNIRGNASHVVPKPVEPKTCSVFTSTAVGVKSKADANSNTVFTVKRGEKVTLTAGPTTNGFAKIVNSAGKTGFTPSQYYTANVNQVAGAETIPNLKTEKANAKFTLNSNQVMKGFPASTAHNSAAIETIKKGAVVTTTGKLSGTYREVKAGAYTGWMLTAQMKAQVVTPAPKPVVIPKNSVLNVDSKGQLWSHGNMAKGKKTLIGSGWSGVRSVAAVDYNNDGIVDVVGTHNDGKLYLWAGTKQGTFTKTVIGNSGWKDLKIHATKMTKTDKYPTIMTVLKNGKLNAYYTSTGKKITSTKAIGSGWSGFVSIHPGYFDADKNVDIIAKQKDGKLSLYRTNGKGFISEKRPVIGTGWKNLTIMDSSDGTGLYAIASGKLSYYGFTGTRKFQKTAVLATTGWSPTGGFVAS